ncbi:MAG: hypothetical protein KJP00_05835, partial [Bacteroidia bacterium]|nr:hypothetical protein [Bacteroidia bacterium]
MKRIKPHIYFLVLFALCFPKLDAQEATPESELDYTIEEFTLPGGQLGNNVNAIAQGPYGFLWFATHGGLIRYDGNEFVTFKAEADDTIPKTGTTLSFTYLENLHWDSDDKLWLCSLGGGLFHYDLEEGIFTNYSPIEGDSSSLSNLRVLCAIDDTNGNLWVGTEEGLNKLDLRTNKFTRYYADGKPGSLINDNIRNLYVDDEGTLWVGSGFHYIPDPGALSKYDPDQDAFQNYQPENTEDQVAPFTVRGMHIDKAGNFWVGTTFGLQRFDREQETFEWMANDRNLPYAPGSLTPNTVVPTYPIIEDREGNIWIGTIEAPGQPSHLLKYDPIHEKSVQFPSELHVWNLCESSNGVIWTAGAGNSSQVLKITPKTKTYDLLEGESVVSGFTETNYYKSRWSGTANLTGPTNMAIDPETGHYWMSILAFQTLASGENTIEPLFILAKYNPKNQQVQYFPVEGLNTRIDPNQVFDVLGLIIDNNERIWFSGPPDDIGLVCFDPKTLKIEEYVHVPGDTSTISSNDIRALMQDSRGRIWAATTEDGLNMLDPITKQVKNYHFDRDGVALYD